MSFFRKLAHFSSQPITTVENHLPGGKIIVPAAISILPGGPGILAAIKAEQAYGNGASIGESLKSGAISGAGSYIGGQIGGQLIGDKLGTFGSTIGQSASNAVGPAYNSSIGSILGNNAGAYAGNAVSSVGGSLLDTSIGSALGSYAGNSIASGALTPSQNDNAMNGPAPFSPKQEDAQNAPTSLSGISSLTSDQQSTNLANQGVYGSGNGPQEQDYFENLINRRLVDQSGQTNDLSTLKPIEQSYLQKLGFGGYGDTSSLLEALSKWKQQQAAA